MLGSPTRENVLERQLNIAGIESRGLDERQIVVTWIASELGTYVFQVCILANCLASSVGTARRCLKSLLFPTSMITMFESA